MSRAVPEWIGKTSDSKVPPHVRMRIFLAHDGRCYLTGRKIRPGEYWELEHKQALCNGGEHREGNLAPALYEPHKIKTARDVKERAKIDRITAELGFAPTVSFEEGLRRTLAWSRG